MEDISSVSSGYEQVCSVILPVLAFLGRKKKKSLLLCWLRLRE